eukprot:symbB.v1.2.001837.t1/scaffold77.1/size347087/8
MDVAQDNLAQVLPAPLLRLSDWRTLVSSCLAALLTFSCAVMTHLAMKYCRGVADTKGQGLRGFLRFFLLATITCLGWAVAWSNWELVLSLMDALEPDRPDHDLTLVRVVIAVCLVVSICFYLRFGPEPIIPDPQLQHLCYSHASLRLVYCLLMCRLHGDGLLRSNLWTAHCVSQLGLFVNLINV